MFIIYFFKKNWNYIKYIFLALSLIIGYFLLNKRNISLAKELQLIQKNHNDEISKLNKCQ